MWFSRSLIWKIIIPVSFILILLSAGVMIYIPSAVKENAAQEAKLKAMDTVEQFKLLRGYYAENVISEVINQTSLQVGIAHDKSGTIPLPATMIHDLSEIYSRKGTQLKLYSPYPFPNRSDRQLDSFAIAAWEHLRINPDSSFSKIVSNENTTLVKVAVADPLISQICVDCHNDHPLSPKVDWEIGEVRGVLEVITQIDDAIINGQILGLKLSLFICVAIIIVITLIFVLHRSLILSPIRKLAHMMEVITKASPAKKQKTKDQSSFNPLTENEIEYLYSSFLNQQQRLEEREKSILDYQKKLEARVQNSTQALVERDTELNAAQTQLKAAQIEIIQNEKLSTLGRMVSSISHEIGTPIGVANTAGSFLTDGTREVQLKIEQNTLKQSDLERFLEDSSEAGKLIQSNLKRASDLMLAFKEIAVDQISERSRSLNLKNYIDEITLSLKPAFKNRPIEIENNIAEDISLDIEAGTLAQIITNLVNNSLIHGFDQADQKGKIIFDCESHRNSLTLSYEDNGNGISTNDMPHVFNQFFTTKKDEGGSGLGLYIINELVTKKLKGELKLISAKGDGFKLLITLPL